MGQEDEESTLKSEGVVCTQQWERLALQCALTRGRLRDPAKGTTCRHLSQCNDKELREYVGRHRQCPIAGCNVCERMSMTWYPHPNDISAPR
eukprot:2826017-Prymnesium_polylepis.1